MQHGTLPETRQLTHQLTRQQTVNTSPYQKLTQPRQLTHHLTRQVTTAQLKPASVKNGEDCAVDDALGPDVAVAAGRHLAVHGHTWTRQSWNYDLQKQKLT